MAAPTTSAETSAIRQGFAAPAHETDVLANVRAIRDDIAARSAEIEGLGHLPQDLIDQLVDAGVWRMFVPTLFGGEGYGLPECFDVLVELARADSSVGWVLMIGFMGATFPTRYPEDEAHALYAQAPTMKIRGAFAPTGVAVPARGGFRVSGRWSFASGTLDVDWVSAMCLVGDDDGAPRMGPDGIPELVMAFVPAADVTFLDDWDVMGMQGTHSEDFVLDDVFVPERFAVGPGGEAYDHTPAHTRLPFWLSVAPGHAAMAIGMAQGALDDLLAIVVEKRPTYNPLGRTADDPVFRHRLGELAVRLDAARIYAHQVTADMWERATTGQPVPPADILRGRAMGAWVTTECVDIVQTAFRLAGRHSIKMTSPLQRRLRDIEVAAQHVAVSGREYRLIGGLLTGAEVAPMDLG